MTPSTAAALSDLHLMRHEVAHLVANFAWGARQVIIQRAEDGNGYETRAIFEDSADVSTDAIFGPFLAGRLCAEGINTAHDEAVIAALAPADVARLWQVCCEVVKPQLDAIGDDTLARMLATIDSCGAILVEREPLQ